MTSTAATARPWILRVDEPVSTGQVPAGVEYHRVYVQKGHRILRGMVAIALFTIGMIGFAIALQKAAAFVDTEWLGRPVPSSALQQAAGALSLVALIPYCMLLQRVLYGLPSKSLHSVAGRFRYGVFGRALLAFGPLILSVVALGSLSSTDAITWTTADLVAFFVIGMVLTPLAAAGEEYGIRGFMFRVLGGWMPTARSGAFFGIVVTTVLFSLAHGTLDPFLLTSYLILFSCTAIVTWRTGGLEVAIVLHGVYNVSALVLATTLHLDIVGQLASRGEAVGSWSNLAPGAVLVLITALVWWMTRRSGPARTTAHDTPTTLSTSPS